MMAGKGGIFHAKTNLFSAGDADAAVKQLLSDGTRSLSLSCTADTLMLYITFAE